MMRIGSGFDVHAFGPGNALTIGGVSIPFDRGFEAHSDGDVLIHAVCDALLGACALGDIGQHFPPDDARWRDCDSTHFLRHVHNLIQAAGYRLVNIDAVLVAQKPRMAPHIPAMRSRMAQVLGVSEGCVSVKATTTERLGFTGREEGIAAHAVCLLQHSP